MSDNTILTASPREITPTELAESRAITHRILMVEDDARVAASVASYLRDFGICTSVCPRGDEALPAFRAQQPELVILDLGLPGLDGMEVCRQLRGVSPVPVLMLSARTDPFDQILGLEIGADDFLAKPFSPRLLLARVRALLRRTQSAAPMVEEDALRLGALEIHVRDRRVIWRNTPVALRTKEFNLLVVLARHAGTVMSRDEILKALRGFGFDGFDRTVDNYIHRLRRRFEDDLAHPERIKTVWGEGYLLSPTAWGSPTLPRSPG